MTLTTLARSGRRIPVPSRDQPAPFHSRLRGQQAGLGAVSPVVQAKLRIGAPNDAFEQEADRLADRMAQMPQSHTSKMPPRVRVQRMCRECEGELRRRSIQEEQEERQAKESPGQTPHLNSHIDVAARLHTGLGGGQPLPESQRRFFESRFVYDFADVRLHHDDAAADLAAAVNARAFTYGHHVVFGSGQFSPGTGWGRRLLAHELTHTIQQGQQRIAEPNEFVDQAASRAVPSKQSTTHSAPISIQRQASPDPEPPVFPNFPGLLTRLEDNVGQNLFDYGHHLYRIAALFPGRSDLLEQAFARYALGANVLETGFMFAGTDPELAPTLALGTGILFKGINFVSSGELVLDFQFDVGHGLKLETSLDLAVNPDPNDLHIRRADVGVGLIGHF